MTAIHDTAMEEVVQSVFSSMLGIGLTRVEADLPPTEHRLAASVQITGQWTGGVVLELSTASAQATAAAMLQMNPQEVTDEDQQDVAAELANMIGGNLKSLLPGASSLSLPTVVAGREVGLRLHDAELIEEASFQSDDVRLRVGLYAKNPT